MPLEWWDRLTVDERNELMAHWPARTTRECEELAEALAAAGVERNDAEREALEQLLREMYPERITTFLPSEPKPKPRG